MLEIYQELGQEVTKNIGLAIRQRRERYAYCSQDRLAKRVYLDRKTIGNIERGSTVSGFADVVAVLRALDLDLVIIERPHEPTP